MAKSNLQVIMTAPDSPAATSGAGCLVPLLAADALLGALFALGGVWIGAGVCAVIFVLLLIAALEHAPA